MTRECANCGAARDEIVAHGEDAICCEVANLWREVASLGRLTAAVRPVVETRGVA